MNGLQILQSCLTVQPVSTIEAAIKTQSDCLSGLKRQSKEQTLLMVMVMLEDLLQFFNVTNQMNQQQHQQTAVLIINEFYYLKPVDLEFFFRRLKTGFYGELYNRIDGNVIMAKLRDYCEERIEKAKELSLLAHKEVNEPIADKVVIFLGDGYLHLGSMTMMQVKQKDMATLFDFKEALMLLPKVKTMDGAIPNKVKIEKAGTTIGIMDYIAKNKPELMPKDIAYTRATKPYFEAKKAIEADTTLSDYEKHNKIRELSGLAPVTESEYNQYLLRIVKK